MALLCADFSESVHDETSDVSEEHEFPFARLLSLVADVMDPVALGFEVPDIRKLYRPNESYCFVHCHSASQKRGLKLGYVIKNALSDFPQLKFS
jgi:hypothetical protein